MMEGCSSSEEAAVAMMSRKRLKRREGRKRNERRRGRVNGRQLDRGCRQPGRERTSELRVEDRRESGSEGAKAGLNVEIGDSKAKICL